MFTIPGTVLSRSAAGECCPTWAARRFAVAPAVAWARHLEILRSAKSRRWCRRTDSNRGPEVYKTPALPTELRRQRTDSTPRLAPVPGRNISPMSCCGHQSACGSGPYSLKPLRQRVALVSATPSAARMRSFGPCDPHTRKNLRFFRVIRLCGNTSDVSTFPQASWRPHDEHR